LTRYLRHDLDKLVESPLDQQRILVQHGFALWDVVESCTRPGSLDQDITNDVPNDIPGFCKEYPGLKRIVLANGKSGAQLFIKHWREWLKAGDFVADETCKDVFAFLSSTKKPTGRAASSVADEDVSDINDGSGSPAIRLYCALAVSPAAARYTYEEKRDWWEKHVFAPGLQDYRNGTGGDEQDRGKR
jgi:hypothetical protein